MERSADAIPSIPLPVRGSDAGTRAGHVAHGAGRHPEQEEIAALRLGLDLGVTMIDTAEMCADGAAHRRGRSRRPDRPGALQPRPPRHRAGPAPLVRAARPSAHGLLADRPGRARWPPAGAGRAVRHGATAAQVALAWVLSRDGVAAIPGAGTQEHVRENRGALDLRLEPADLAELDRAFPPPDGPGPLAVV